MAGIDDIVSVSITRETIGVSRAGFGTMLILDSHFKFAEPVRSYTDMTGVAEDFSSSDVAYAAAQAAFGASPRVTSLKVANRGHQGANVEVTTNTVGATYTLKIFADGTLYTVTATGAASAALTVDAIITAIGLVSGLSSLVSTTDNGSDFDIDIDGSCVGFTLYADSKMTCTHGSATYTDEPDGADPAPMPISDSLDMIKLYDPDWYVLALTSRYPDDQENAATWTESEYRMCILATADANVLDASDTSDIAYILSAASRTRTFVIYQSQTDSGDSYINDGADEEWPDVAWLGKCLPYDLDTETITWKFKTLSGVTADSLTATEKAAAEGKSCNIYIEVGGVNITTEGVVAEGEYIDVIHGIDWLRARLQEDVYETLVNKQKVPYTNAGISMVENRVRARLNYAIGTGFLAFDSTLGELGYRVETPDITDVPSADKISRTLNNVKFSGTLAGAIHAVTITGSVAV